MSTPHPPSGPAASPPGAAFDAVRDGDVAALRAALDGGTPPTACNESGDSLLMLAAYHGREDCLALLVERGADPDVCNHKGQHPLAGACYKGATSIVAGLLGAGASAEGSATSARSPLMYAAMYNHAPATRLLLDHGADPARRSPEGKTALDLAREMRAVHTIALLEAATRS